MSAYHAPRSAQPSAWRWGSPARSSGDDPQPARRPGDPRRQCRGRPGADAGHGRVPPDDTARLRLVLVRRRHSARRGVLPRLGRARWRDAGTFGSRRRRVRFGRRRVRHDADVPLSTLFRDLTRWRIGSIADHGRARCSTVPVHRRRRGRHLRPRPPAERRRARRRRRARHRRQASAEPASWRGAARRCQHRGRRADRVRRP